MGTPKVIASSGTGKHSSELDLDTKDVCFLCLKITDSSTAAEGDHNHNAENCGGSKVQIWNLRNLSRFLRIDLTKKIVESLPSASAVESIEWSDVKVHLCPECHTIALKFTDLYESLELTKLRLTECVDKINQVVIGSSNDPKRVEEAKERLKKEETDEGGGVGGEGPFTLKVMTNLRDDVAKNGAMKIKMDSPQLPLDRVDEKAEPQSKSVLDEEETVIDLTNDNDPDPEVVPSEPEPTPVVEVGPNCRFCSETLFKSEQALEKHEAKFHSHVIFASHRVPQISEDVFIRTVYHVLFPTIYAKLRNVNKNSRTCLCPYCPRSLPIPAKTTFTSINDILRGHLVKEHMDFLTVELRNIQSDPKEIERKLKEELAREGMFGKLCSCGYYLETRMNFESHQSQYKCAPGPEEDDDAPKAELIMPQPQPTPEELKGTCEFCSKLGKWTRGPTKVSAHKMKFHCHEFLKDHRLAHIDPETFTKIVHHILFKGIIIDREKVYQCPYCSHVTPRSMNKGPYPMRQHLITAHMNKLSVELRKLQNDPGEVKKQLEEEKRTTEFTGFTCSCGCYLASDRIASFHCAQFQCKYPTAPKPTTTEEEKEKEDEPEVLILDDPEPEPGPSQPSGVSADVVVVELEPQMIITKCSYCNASFKEFGADSLKIHMVQFHLDKFFVQELGSTLLTRPQFIIILHYLLFADLEAHTAKLKLVQSSATYVSCPYCEKIFKERMKGKASSEIRLHLIEEHRDELVDRLNMLQQDPQALAKVEGYSLNGQMCDCGDYFPTFSNFAIHKGKYCRVSKAIKLPNSSKGHKAKDNANANNANRRRRKSTCSKKKQCKWCKDFFHPASLTRHIERSCEARKAVENRTGGTGSDDVEVVLERSASSDGLDQGDPLAFDDFEESAMIITGVAGGVEYFVDQNQQVQDPWCFQFGEAGEDDQQYFFTNAAEGVQEFEAEEPQLKRVKFEM